jgi:hypothetical protein
MIMSTSVTLTVVVRWAAQYEIFASLFCFISKRRVDACFAF